MSSLKLISPSALTLIDSHNRHIPCCGGSANVWGLWCWIAWSLYHHEGFPPHTHWKLQFYSLFLTSFLTNCQTSEAILTWLWILNLWQNEWIAVQGVYTFGVSFGTLVPLIVIQIDKDDCWRYWKTVRALFSGCIPSCQLIRCRIV